MRARIPLLQMHQRSLQYNLPKVLAIGHTGATERFREDDGGIGRHCDRLRVQIFP